MELESAVAVSTTDDPLAKVAEQLDPQLIPEGLLVIVPLPVPTLTTPRVTCCGRTVVVAVAVRVVPATVAVLVISPAVVGVTTMVTAALAPPARAPRLQVTVVEHEPWVGVAETKVTPDGSGSVTVTGADGAGALLVTVIV